MGRAIVGQITSRSRRWLSRLSDDDLHLLDCDGEKTTKYLKASMWLLSLSTVIAFGSSIF